APVQSSERRGGRRLVLVAAACDAVVERHLLTPGMRRRLVRAGCATVRPTSASTMSLTPREKRAFGSSMIAGTPELMLFGTDASSCRTNRIYFPLVSPLYAP